jgi:hypothetical protein
MQLQRYSRNTTQFSGYAEELSNYVKDKNPSTKIFVQLSFRFTDDVEMIRAANSVRSSVDGYVIAYLPSEDCGNNCNPEALDRILTEISSH